VNIKKLLWDDLPRDILPELISKMLQRAAVMFCLQYSIKFIDITVVSVISNTAPLATAILGFLMLSEKISTVEIISLFTSFIGVLILTTAGEEKENRYDLDESTFQVEQMLAWAFLIACPILMGIGAI